MRDLREVLEKVELGPPFRIEGLDFVPLFRGVGGSGGAAVLLEEAIAEGRTSVTEVSEQGLVGQVRVTHGGRVPLLLLDGEQIAGAKQNRVFNASFVVPPGATVDLPVSCVERGRWVHRSAEFTVSGTTLELTARGAKLRRMTHSTLTTSRAFDAGQGEVWRDVDHYLERTGTVSATAAYDDAFTSRAGTIEERLALLPPQPAQVGVAVVHGDRMLAFDLFASPELYARSSRKVLRGALAAMLPKPHASRPPHSTIAAALQQLTQAPLQRRPTPAEGESWLVTAGGVSFSGAVYRDQLYHAVAAEVA